MNEFQVKIRDILQEVPTVPDPEAQPDSAVDTTVPSAVSVVALVFRLLPPTVKVKDFAVASAFS